MKNKFYLFTLLFAGLYSWTIQGQEISQNVLNNYPASVVTRVYNIVKVVPLSEARQDQLAQNFNREDSLLLEAIKSSNPERIKQIQDGYGESIHLVLSEDELNSYYNSNASTYATKLAKAESYAINTRIKGDDQTEKYLFNTCFNKYMIFESVLNHSHGEVSDIQSGLAEIASRYDSIVQGQIKTFTARKYIGEQVAFLNTIRPLDKANEEKLKKTFLILCNRKGEDGFTENFRKAMVNTVKDTIYYSALNSDDIKRQASYNSIRQSGKYIRDYKLNKKSVDDIRTLLYEREKRLAVIDYAYPLYSPEKEKMINSTAAYFDSLINNSLYKEGIKTPDNWFFKIVRQKNYLTLSQEQVDSLTNKGFQLERIMDAKKQGLKGYENYSTVQYEREQVPKILTEEQYNKFLIRENLDVAKKYALENWKEIKQRGLAQQQDSIQFFKQLEKYELARAVAVDRYKHDKARKSANIRAIEQSSMPSIMRSLKAARRIKTPADSTQNSTNEKAYKGTFQW